MRSTAVVSAYHMDYDLARAIGRDEGNRSMRVAGRNRWSREDYDRAEAAFSECMTLVPPAETGPMCVYCGDVVHGDPHNHTCAA
jgi:hypothetical protein